MLSLLYLTQIQAAVQHCRFATVLVLANTSQAEGGNVQRGLEVGGRELLFLRCAAQGEVTTWFVHHMEPRCSSNKKELGLDKTVSIAMGILDVHFRRTDDNTDSLYHKLVKTRCLRTFTARLLDNSTRLHNALQGFQLSVFRSCFGHHRSLFKTTLEMMCRRKSRTS